MWKKIEKVLQRLGLKKTEDKFITVDGVKVRMVTEPYLSLKKFRVPPPKSK